ncbi:MAG: FkbM family methyltransferase [Rhodobiaceae bacterium]|nr:hypothetical protein [Rhodobiaceae bacterium]MCC0052864.1 FkbM family methyltransferase [Rhodobiaceae bacterium]
MRRARLIEQFPFLAWPIGRVRMHTAKNNYLYSSGWVRSLGTFLPADAEGKPLPWYSYPAIEFLSERLTRDLSVLEYGAGNSTLWYAARVGHVVSVEDHAGWAERLRQTVPGNVTIKFATGDEYASAAAASGTAYDIVVVDGAMRNDCALRSASSLSPGGIFVWDDAQREEYKPGFDALKARGFRKIDFYGLAPINATPKSTAILYRDANVLGI